MDNPQLPSQESFQSGFSAWLFKVYRKPLQFLFIILVLPLSAVVIATHHASAGMARYQAMLNLRMTAKVASEAIAATLNEAVLFSQVISSNPNFLDAVARSDAQAIQAAIQVAVPALPDADEVIVADHSGKVIAVVSGRETPMGSDLSQSEAFLGVMENGWQPYVSSVRVRDEESFEKIVEAAFPVARKDERLGVLIVTYRIESVRLWVQRVRVEPEGFIYVADQKNQLVVYPFQVLPGKPKQVNDWPPVAQQLLPDGFSMSFRDQKHGRRWLSGVHPISETLWRVVAVQPDDAVLRVMRRIFLPMSALILILLGLVLYVSLRWAALQALNFRLLQQNAKLLKQSQQRWTLEQGKTPNDRQGGVST